MIQNLDTENLTITYNGETYNLKSNLDWIGKKEEGSRQSTYLRRPTKLTILKELKKRYPDTYQEIKKFAWFADYKEDLGEDEEGEMIMNTEIITNFTNAINKISNELEGLSDKHKVAWAQHEVHEYVEEIIKKEYPNLPKTIDVRVTEDKIQKVEGLTHKIFPKVCKLANMSKSIMLSGPAGTGKNYLIEQVAKALDGKFFYSSTITQEYKLTGFIDANGNYHSTELRRAMDYANEHPDKKAIMMIDEIDASVSDTLVVINSVLANGYFDFPDKRVSVGKNFIVICAGNTVGLGADMVYTGRNVIDGATLDRFILVKMNYDENLERALCPDDELKNFIYDIRKSAQKNHINCIVGMRCLKNAYEMLVNGFDKQDIVSDAIIKGLGEDDINVLKNDLNSNNEWYKYFKYIA